MLIQPSFAVDVFKKVISLINVLMTSRYLSVAVGDVAELPAKILLPVSPVRPLAINHAADVALKHIALAHVQLLSLLNCLLKCSLKSRPSTISFAAAGAVTFQTTKAVDYRALV